uniref:DUF4218 domain-containing protein n=1 Tax=Cajanus cajan TaxID=3821 RepID=A0A151UET9_CAJCA
MEMMMNNAFEQYRQHASNIGTSRPLNENEILNDESRRDYNGFYELLNDGSQTLYEGSKYTKLEFIIKLYHIKVLCGLSDKAMTMILDLLKDAFEEAKFPPSIYEAKKIINKLGLNYKKFVFFTVMVHLTVHLLEEAKLGGPMHYRYMYPVERELGHLKSFVRNKAQLEGSIAEGYLVEESLTFCSRYIEDIETRFNKPKRVCDDPIDNDTSFMSSIFPQIGKLVGVCSMFTLTPMKKLQAHRYVLLNCTIVTPFLKRFRNPQKSAPQPQCDAPLTQALTHSVPIMNPEILSTPSDSSQALEVPTINVPLSHVSTSEVPQEDETTRLPVGRESTQCWNVEAIDSEDTVKKIKVKVRGVNSLLRELRIIVDFDDQGQAIGEAQALLAGFLGTLAADCKLFPMDYDRWSGPSGVPKAYFDDCFETILKLLETGKIPSRGKLYIETHKRKDGSFVNDAAKTIVEQIKVGLTQSIVDEYEVSPLDVVGRVLGPEHYGRVRCMGLGVVPSNTFRNTRLRISSLSSSSSSVAFPSLNQWQVKYNNLE